MSRLQTIKQFAALLMSLILITAGSLVFVGSTAQPAEASILEENSNIVQGISAAAGGILGVAAAGAVGVSGGAAALALLGGGAVASAAVDKFLLDEDEFSSFSTYEESFELTTTGSQNEFQNDQITLSRNVIGDQDAKQLEQRAIDAAVIKFVEDYNNKSISTSKAKSNALREAREVISDQQVNLINGYERQVATAHAKVLTYRQFNQQVDNISNLDNTTQVYGDGYSSDGAYSHPVTTTNGSLYNLSIKLANGETKEYATIKQEAAQGFDYVDGSQTASSQSIQKLNISKNYAEATSGGGLAEDAGIYYNGSEIIDHNKYANQYQLTQDAETDAINQLIGDTSNNTDGLLDKQANNLATGEVDVSDVLTPAQWNKLNTGPNDQSYYDSILVGSEYGSAGNVSGDVVISLPDSSENITGQLYTTSAPPTTDSNGNPVWETNTTYNASNISGPVYFARNDYTSNEDPLLKIEGEFTIQELNFDDRQGETTQVVYKDSTSLSTSNATELKQRIKQLQKRIDELEEEEDNNGFLPFLPDNFFVQIVALMMIGAGLYLLAQKNIREQAASEVRERVRRD